MKATVFRFTLKRYFGISLFWGLLFAFIVIVNAIGTIAANIDLNKLAALSSNAGLFALFGQGHALNTIEGFVTWKASGSVSVIMAIWILITSATIFRGDEEDGRLELLASGQATLGSITKDAFIALYTCIAIIFSCVLLFVMIFCNIHGLHFSFEGTVLLAFSFIASGLLFASITGLLGQLFISRQQTLFFSILLYATFYMLRILADGISNLSFLNNINPLGWIENIQPYTANNIAWLIPIFLLSVFFTVVAIVIAYHRDIAASVITPKERVHSKLWLLGNWQLFMIRQMIGPFLGWVSGIALLGFILGSVAQSAGNILSSSTRLDKLTSVLAQSIKTNAINGYLGVGFLIIIIYLIFLAISLIGKLTHDEVIGYADNIFVRPVQRGIYLMMHVFLSFTQILFIALIAGLAIVVGGASNGTTLLVSSMLQAGINALAPAIFIIGVGYLLYGIFPRKATTGAYLVFGWSLLIYLFGPTIKLPDFFLNTSIFYHLAQAPAVDPDWHVVIILCAIGIVCTAFGVLTFNKRDMISD